MEAVTDKEDNLNNKEILERQKELLAMIEVLAGGELVENQKQFL